MIESILEKLAISGPDPENRSDPDGLGGNAERSFLEALPIIQNIVRRRRAALKPDESSELAQGIALRLWTWRDKYREKSEAMSANEWMSFAARTAYNEINRHFTKASGKIAVSIEAARHLAGSSIEGETGVEVLSMIRSVWQEVSALSLRQRRALLLHSQQLIIYFLQSGVLEIELARVLDLDSTEWNEIRSRLPLSDLQIAEVVVGKSPALDLNATARSIKKARHEARTKLGGVGIK